MKKNRCNWCLSDQIYRDYHDFEWGLPNHDDQKLFEMLTLEGAQAGLSWITVLKKRENYRQAFDNFNPEIIARYDEKKYDELLLNAGIIRNKLKIKSTITNAQAYLRILDSGISFSDYIWNFVDGAPIKNSFNSLSDVPPKTERSDRMSKQLKKDGFKFIGSTITYAFMQATGMVNDHLVDCFRYDEV